MKVAITKASDDAFREITEVKTLDEFCTLLREVGECIVGEDYEGDADFEVKDYDTYIE